MELRYVPQMVFDERGAGPAAVLFDIGGVLFVDPWEALCLTPGSGLADRLGLERSAVQEAGTALWPRYCTRSVSAGTYWAALSQAVGHDISPGDVEEAVRTTLKANPAAEDLFSCAAALTGGRTGLISDNTSFFFPLQDAVLNLSARVPGELSFLSFARGLSKSTANFGLFERAAEDLHDHEVLVVDDRQHNVDRARSAGLRAHLMPSWEPTEVAGALRAIEDFCRRTL